MWIFLILGFLRHCLENRDDNAGVRFKGRIEIEITDSIYSMQLNVKRGQNEKFAVTPVLRDGRDSNSQRPA